MLMSQDHQAARRIARRRLLHGGHFSLNDLDRKLEKYVDYDNGFYVELGANDGYTQSNSFYFELKRSWRGILIEPSPHKYLQCLKFRGQVNDVYCNACVGFDYKEKFVEIVYANLMSFAPELALDLGETSAHLDRAQHHMDAAETTFSFGAVAVPLSTLLDRSAAPDVIDFLSLDVEGGEFDVLRGIDHARHRFRYILVEAREPERIEAYLADKGYRLTDQFTHHDYLFSSEAALR